VARPVKKKKKIQFPINSTSRLAAFRESSPSPRGALSTGGKEFPWRFVLVEKPNIEAQRS